MPGPSPAGAAPLRAPRASAGVRRCAGWRRRRARASAARAGSADRCGVERAEGLVGERADPPLDLGVGARGLDDAGAARRPRRPTGRGRAGCRAAARRPRARAPRGRGRPARCACPPTGRRRRACPVTSGSPKTPSRSSRSWNASPSGSPNADSAASALGGGAGEGGADVQRPLDGVLRGLVAQHLHRQLDVGRRRGPAPRRRGTGRRSPRCGWCRRTRARRARRRGRARSGGAARRTRTAAGRRAGSPRPRRTAPGRRTSPARGGRPRTRGAWPAGRGACRRRPCSRRGPARSRAAARARPRPGPARPRRARRTATERKPQ